MPKVRAGANKPAGQQADDRLGFLAAGHDPQLGFLAGLLVTNPSSCPIEFHYVSPIRPTRTQTILYGAELEPYIYRSLVVPALVGQVSVAPAFLITDQPHVLGYRPCFGKPILLVEAAASSHCCPQGEQEQKPAEQSNRRPEMQTCRGFEQDAAALRSWLQHRDLALDLAEPLQRVWEALRELAAESARAA